MNKVLVLAPHTDDESIGCGGFLAKAVGESMYKTAVLCFSDCSFPGIKTEFDNVSNLLEYPSAILSFPVRIFNRFRQEILDSMIAFGKSMKDLGKEIDSVLVPSTYEIHQDHQVITQEAIRAFKHCTILGYELPWNNIESKHQCTIELTKEQVEKKIEACSMYKSQAHRPYMNPEFIRSWAKMRGVQNGCEYAEVFEVIKLRL